jgi:tellurite methyltransferase
MLEGWIHHVPLGHALDIGAGKGEVALWLSRRGFKVDAVEQDPETGELLRESCKGSEVILHHIDIRDYVFPEETYSLIHASAVLHFIPPTDLWPLADRIIASLVSGGFLFAEVFTTDDPGYEILKGSGVKQVEPNTFVLPSSDDVIHYFMPGELPRTFSGLEILEYQETRRVDLEDPKEYRSGASMVAQKKY